MICEMVHPKPSSGFGYTEDGYGTFGDENALLSICEKGFCESVLMMLKIWLGFWKGKLEGGKWLRFFAHRNANVLLSLKF